MRSPDEPLEVDVSGMARRLSRHEATLEAIAATVAAFQEAWPPMPVALGGDVDQDPRRAEETAAYRLMHDTDLELMLGWLRTIATQPTLDWSGQASRIQSRLHTDARATLAAILEGRAEEAP